MGRDRSLWEHFGGGRLAVDAVILAVLGLLEYAILSHPSSIQPGEGAVLVMAFAGLLILGRRGLTWQRDLVLDAFLPDWIARVAAGSRERVQPPQGLSAGAELTARALDALLADVEASREALADLQEAVVRDWRDVDGALAEVRLQQVADRENRDRAADRLAAAGAELKTVFEESLQLDRIELDQRLRADQWRLQAQAFVGSLEQVRTGLDHFENLVEELRDTFPRLLREGDDLGRLANSGMRHGARMGMAVRGLVEHTPRLLEEARTRRDQFRNFRKAADELRDQAEALGRRLEGFRTDALDRTRAFGGVQGSLRVIDEAAQQAGLLAVNAAILSQQGTGGGGAGIQAIGGRLRHLAGQTSRGVAEVERTLEEHARGLDHETASLWTLQEVTETLLSGLQNLLRSAAYLDQQGQELERLLDTQVAQVDHVRQMSEHAELALHEVGERARAIESAMGRLWAVEAKLLPELERLSRGGARLTDSGRELSQISQQNIEAIWNILARHHEIRRSAAYRQVTAGELGHLLAAPPTGDGSPARVAWVRSLRRARLGGARLLPALRGTREPDGTVRLRLLGLDALGLPEPSAIQQVVWSRGGRDWRLDLREELRAEDHRMALLETLRGSELQACFPELQTRITPEGAFLSLPFALGQLPVFLAGLALDLPLSAEGWDGPLRAPAAVPGAVQTFLWIGPDADPSLRRETLRRVHGLVHDVPDHHLLLPQAPFEGERSPCLWLGEVEDAVVDLAGVLPFRFETLGAPGPSAPAWRERLLQAGGREDQEGAALVTVHLAPVDPALLLLQLYRREARLACVAHPTLAPYRDRARAEVFALEAADPTRAAWEILEAFRTEGWLLPLPAL
ncbi:hypothetical protein GETHPA_17490 [Geothrix rubra]|uniref:Methyl-accepting transducer domain-containing protein n=2 Tax=Geothrix rubra TaxID=2927977 RepID=A0ABQ5Q6Y4_9BACT|nr:hypothetical protein GETHPA_17490 [Geothrix rubra]